jgi:regulator of sigma E protease
VLIGLVAFIGLSVLILLHEAAHFAAAKLFGLRVHEFGLGFPPRLFAWKKGETEYSVNLLFFGGFVRIAGENDRLADASAPSVELSPEERGRFFSVQSAWKRATVIAAGVLMNFVIGWFLFSGVFIIGTEQAVVVTGIQPGSPAEAAGFETGDLFTAFKTSEEFIRFVNANRGVDTDFSIRRGAEEVVLRAVPRVVTEEGEGALGVYLGDAGFSSRPFFAALRDGFWQTGLVFWYTLTAFGELLQSIFLHARIPAGVAGPVGIFSVAQETGKLGFIYLVQLLALISVNLSVLNLIPFPALDGGRLALIAVEKLKGSPVSARVEAFLNGLGFAFLMLLFLGITVNDIVRLFR